MIGALRNCAFFAAMPKLLTLALVAGVLFLIQLGPRPANASGPAVVSGSVATDRAALVALYDATDGDNWRNNTNWKTNAPLHEWHGVTTSFGRVVRLQLYRNELTGRIPSDLGNLTFLVELSLYRNELSGRIPSELGNLRQLEELKLYRNNLTGRIPASLGNLTNLTVLNLAVNDLSGPIPSSLSNLTKLRELNLHTSGLSGAVPLSLGNLSNLTRVQLRGNSGLTGCIPDALQNVPDNDFDRVGLPYCSAFLGNATNLRAESGPGVGKVTLRWTPGENATVHVIAWVTSGGTWTLWPVRLGGNARQYTMAGLMPGRGYWFTMKAGRATPGGMVWSPTWTRVVSATAWQGEPDRAALIALYEATGGANWTNTAGWNSDLPLERWVGVTVDDGGRVTELRLPSNNMRGPLPGALNDLSELRVLNLRNNGLTGRIPQGMSRLTQLRHLDLHGNRLSLWPTTPEAWEGNFVNLELLDLSDNGLGGEIPEALGTFSNLTTLMLKGNPFQGCIPYQLARLATWQFEEHDLFELYPDVRFCADPEPDRLTLQKFIREMHGDGREWFLRSYEWKNYDNWFDDDRPLNAWHGVTADGAGNVTVLSLKDNNLHGDLSSRICELSRLEILDLSDNDIDELPVCLGDMSNLRWLDLNDNERLNVPEELDRKLEERKGQLYYLNLVNERLGALATERKAVSLALDAATGTVEAYETLGIRRLPRLLASLNVATWLSGKLDFVADNAGLLILFGELRNAGDDDNERFAAALRYLGAESSGLTPLATIRTEDFDCFTDPSRQWWDCTGP